MSPAAAAAPADEALISQLIDLFARLVTDGSVTEAEAIRIIADTSPARLALLLPLAPGAPAASASDPFGGEDEIAAVSDHEIAGAWQITGWTQSQRIALSDRLGDRHEAQTAANAARLADGQITLAQWQERQQEINSDHTRAQSIAGADTAARLSETAIRQVIQEQAAYLQRFADETAGRLIAGDDLQLAGLIARASLYAGAGAALFWQLYEQHRITRVAGWIIYYTARDDDRTCAACSSAEGYYLPNRGPYPGAVCYGHGRCRCRRIASYDAARYAELLVQSAA